MQKKETIPAEEDYVSTLIQSGEIDRYKVPFGQHLGGAINAVCRPVLKWMAYLEQLTWEDQIKTAGVVSPVYVCGLARAGTTVILELLNDTGCFATHRYRDYPFIDIPILWNKWQKLFPEKDAQTRERAHFDGIMVTPDSPEAFEEMIWMSFFPDCHNPHKSNTLDASANNPDFEAYYETHIRKILWLRQKERYLAKGNYNLMRIRYLQNIFPDAKFIIPIRDPVAHIASLMKQHRLFCEMELRDPRALKYMQWAGHYEFGLNRTPINTGDQETVERIIEAWSDGDEITGWALYWDILHRWLFETLEKEDLLRKSTKIVDYNTLCAQPGQGLEEILDHCSVSVTAEKLESLSGKVKQPAYYKSSLPDQDIKKIENITATTYQKLL